MKEILEKLKNGVLDAVFPTTCIGCGKEGKYICTRCEGFVSEVALACPICQQSSFDGQRHKNCRSLYGLDGLVSVWEYEGLMKSLLYYIKYNGITHAAKETTKRAFTTMVWDEKRFQPFLSFLSFEDTFLAYVPMYRRKERRRGFNQAAVLANEIGKTVNKGAISILEKLKDTKPQIDLSKEERLYNIKDTFTASLYLGAGRAERVILVDDVWTTGATMKECCRVLKKVGVKEVWGFTIARTP
tara:strand:- start:7033 stop:7761 length:729 start_codon:yes stop_codon:yes gene_type:complete